MSGANQLRISCELTHHFSVNQVLALNSQLVRTKEANASKLFRKFSKFAGISLRNTMEPVNILEIAQKTYDRIKKRNSELLNQQLMDTDSKATTMDDWIGLVCLANSREELAKVLDAFRPGAWTDEQRARMSQAYMARLKNLSAP